MNDVLSRLEPRPVFSHFAELTQVPRPSKHEEKVSAWARSVAARHGFAVSSDAIGNLVIDVPASPGKEKAPTVILQGHLDMVCEKNKGVDHDFMNDPIKVRVEGEWVYATGTTLGADNGIGVAAALGAATDPSVVRPPLQLLFTVDEETGLTGALQLDGSMLRGRTLINLDSEEDGVLFVGCSGGADTVLTLDVARTAPARGARGMVLEVRGLRGGHSGLNIHENRGNALKVAAHTLFSALSAGLDVQVASIAGGSKHNAIPREADAVLAVGAGDAEKLRGIVDCMREAYKGELSGIDDGLTLELKPQDLPAEVWTAADRDRVLRLLVALPHGVLGMSPAIPGLVETSNNLAVVQTDGAVTVTVSSRSSVASTLRAVQAAIRAQGEMAGAHLKAKDGYPGWKPNLASPVLGVTREVYREVWGREPKVTAIHAGLECGLLGEKVPGLDMVSFGPWLEGVHSPDERMNIPSVGRFYEALKRVLARLADARA